MFLRRQRQTEESGPYWRQRGWQLSAGFLALVVVVGAVVALTSGGDGSAEAAAPTPGPLSGALTKDGRPVGCHTDDSAGDALPKAAPKDVTWRTIGVTRVPVSATAGPTQTKGTPWWCFSHTAMGAVVAAHVITAQTSEPGWQTVVKEQLVAGSGRDMFEFTREISGDSASRGVDKSMIASYAGFSVLSCTRTAASVSLLMRNQQGFMSTSINLRWEKGDWKILPADSGSLFSKPQSVQNTNDYLVWGS
ncbi:hypothetical protein ACJ6WF_22690 [Streptomyces sp. MMS24-I2-30]|uniref:hypothetical protein n=1 Tax=Streptomyces sp. MMS24-I2-30 TaxID=3351564 RepID=UPI003896C663